jgi:hypothetical protein
VLNVSTDVIVLRWPRHIPTEGLSTLVETLMWAVVSCLWRTRADPSTDGRDDGVGLRETTSQNRFREVVIFFKALLRSAGRHIR